MHSQLCFWNILRQIPFQFVLLIIKLFLLAIEYNITPSHITSFDFWIFQISWRQKIFPWFPRSKFRFFILSSRACFHQLLAQPTKRVQVGSSSRQITQGQKAFLRSLSASSNFHHYIISLLHNIDSDYFLVVITQLFIKLCFNFQVIT